MKLVMRSEFGTVTNIVLPLQAQVLHLISETLILVRLGWWCILKTLGANPILNLPPPALT